MSIGVQRLMQESANVLLARRKLVLDLVPGIIGLSRSPRGSASAHARTGRRHDRRGRHHDRYVLVRRRPPSFSGLYQPGEPAGGC